MRFLPLPLQERADSEACQAGQMRLAMGFGSAKFNPAGPPLRFRRQDTRPEALLRNLLKITRNRGGVNASVFLC
jgi:hypothetical protein